jgi:protein-L-isoaspartate(D-aspartate) O-methyltransferase
MRSILSRREALLSLAGTRNAPFRAGLIYGILNQASERADKSGRALAQVSSIPEKNRDATGRKPVSCPNCGFDIEPGKPCQVCGYTPQGSAAGAQSQAQSRQGIKTPPKRRGGALVALLVAAGGLLVLLGVFILTTEILPRGESAQNSQPSSDAAALPAAPTQPPAEGASVPDAAASTAGTPEAGSASQSTNGSASPPAALAAAPASSSSTGILLSGPGLAVPFDVATRTDNPPFNNKEAFVSWMLKHTDQQAKYLRQRWDRAAIIQRLGNFTHERVREAFLRTPREYFSRDPARSYENAVLPIGYGQTISGPHLVSRMTDYLDPLPEQKVLEIGTGSGYQSALLSEISNHVYTIEIVEKLARQTNAIYTRLEPRYPEYTNIKRKVDDGYYGWPEYAPFDRIIVTCGIDHVPPALIRQLAPGGIMVIPVGPPSGQTILRIIKKVAPDGTVSLEREDIYHGKHKQIFVPFTARGGGVHRADGQN